MATIKDVAKLAGVGVGTASRVISGNGSVSATTMARVQEAVRALDFRPSQVARALSLKSTGMLGVYVPVFEGTFYTPILQAIDQELRSVDKHMVAASGWGQGNAREQALQGIEFLMQRECDGILVLSPHLTDGDLRDVYRKYPKLVVLNRVIRGMASNCFSTDHELAGRLAARALLHKGHRKIATIQGINHGPDIGLRMAGFHKELSTHGVTLEPQYQYQVDGLLTVSSGHDAALGLLALPKRDFTALFCANDSMAMAAISAFTTAGYQVPRDLSVIGYDDLEMAPYTSPPLSTIHIPVQALSVHGCRHLLNQCYGLNLTVHRKFPPSIVWRHSLAEGPATPIPLPA